MREIVWSLVHIELKDVFSYLSVFSAATVLVFVIAIASYKPHLISRVSLRLQAGVSAADLILAITNIRYTMSVEDKVWCANNGIFRIASQIIYCFLNICLALNLQLVFLHKITMKNWWEKIYWLVSVSLTLFIVIPMIGMGYFGFDGRGCKFEKNVGINDFLVQLTTLYLIMVTLAYCTIISVLVMIKLATEPDCIDAIQDTIKFKIMSKRSHFHKFIRKLILRVSLYLACCFICYSGQAAVSMARLFDYQSEFLIDWLVLGLALGGVVNLISFILDPTFHLALKEIHKDYSVWRRKNRQDRRIEFELVEGELRPKAIYNTNPDSILGLLSNERLISETFFL